MYLLIRTSNSLATTLAYKFGYGDDLERFKKEGRAKFSLVEDKTLEKPCAKLLLVNVSCLSSSEEVLSDLLTGH